MKNGFGWVYGIAKRYEGILMHSGLAGSLCSLGLLSTGVASLESTALTELALAPSVIGMLLTTGTVGIIEAGRFHRQRGDTETVKPSILSELAPRE